MYKRVVHCYNGHYWWHYLKQCNNESITKWCIYNITVLFSCTRWCSGFHIKMSIFSTDIRIFLLKLWAIPEAFIVISPFCLSLGPTDVVVLIVDFIALHLALMRRNSIQHHAPPDDPDSLISLLLILLCVLVWFYAYKCYICLPISAHGLWERLMILTLFARLT